MKQKAMDAQEAQTLLDAEVSVPYFDGANLLLAADKKSYDYATFHPELSAGKLAFLGCPPNGKDKKIARKLAQIMTDNDVESLTLVHWGDKGGVWLERAAEEALRASGKLIAYDVVTVQAE